MSGYSALCSATPLFEGHLEVTDILPPIKLTLVRIIMINSMTLVYYCAVGVNTLDVPMP